MTPAKYIIEEKSREGEHITFTVRLKDEDPYDAVWVDYYSDSKKVFCCSCSGPLSAQLSSCNHAKAVKRFADKIKTK